MSRSCILVLVVLAGCSSSNSGLPSSEVDRNPSLHQVTSCNQLENAIENSVVLEMKSTLEQLKTGWGWIGPGGVAMGAGAAGPTAAAAAGPSSYTTTNVQVAGVDEADFVQNDGTRIAALADGQLHLIQSWPPEAMAEVSHLPIEGWPRDLFLAGNEVIVFSSLYTPRPLEGAHPVCLASSIFCGYYASDFLKVTTIDVSDLSAPKITAEIFLPGTYQSARRIDQRVRLVYSDTLPYPDGVRFWPDLPPGATTEQRNAAFDALEVQNEAIIRGQSLDDWIRTGKVKHPDGSTTALGYNCTDFSLSSAPSLPGLLTVATIDLGNDTVVGRTSVLADPGTVYASKDTLYVASSHWWWWPAPGQIDATYIHAFDLTNPDRAAYVGSGVVDGRVRDQYGMDEFHGALRIATNLATRVPDPQNQNPWGLLKISNRISILGRANGSLPLLGKTDDFGADEQTFGTRFLGTRGFIITAKQVDPLFTFDLSDPAHPIKVGELPMPGFIAYLHPIDDTHLLGIGRERASSTGPMQLKVALLDVTDLGDPKVVAVQLVGEGWSWSDALWDPHAFTWLGARQTLAIPFADFASNNFVSDLRLFKVDVASGITPLGSLPMGDVFTTFSGPGWSYSWSPWVRRGILADEFVYAISDAGVRSARVADLPAWLQTVHFPPLPAP
jgi:uncharacterized secreted protein with C-terminal beta-propeller domain